MSGLNQIIAAFFGALGFAFLFNLHGKEIFYTSLEDVLHGACIFRQDSSSHSMGNNILQRHYF